MQDQPYLSPFDNDLPVLLSKTSSGYSTTYFSDNTMQYFTFLHISLNIKMSGICDKKIKIKILFLLKLIRVNFCNAFLLMWLHWKHMSWLFLFTEWRAQKQQNWIPTYGPKTAFFNIKIAQLLHIICWILDRLQTSAKHLWEKKKVWPSPFLPCRAKDNWL